MEKLYTHDQFVEKMKEMHPDMVVLGHYKDTMEKVRIRHQCGYEWDAVPFNMLHGMGCPVCNKSVRKPQEVFVKEVAEVDDNIEVIGEYKSNKTKIKIRYKDCGHEHEMRPSDILKGQKCPYCASRKLLVGFNDIATTQPWMVQYMVDPEDAKRYMCNSKTKVLCRCPDCGHEEKKTIASMYTHGFHCFFCDDGLSYPNKFSRELLKQLPVEGCEYEYQPDWAGRRKYDNYFRYNGKEYILEMDGGFHYKDDKFEPLEQVQAIDRLKNQIAEEHGITMIRIECLKSDKDYIANHIKESLMGQLFDLSVVDWDRCDSLGSSSVIKDCCTFYEEHKYDMSFRAIAKQLKIAEATLQRYRKIGVSAGWCTYDEDESQQLKSIHIGESVSRPVVVYDDQHNKLYEFKSLNACVSYMNNNYDENFSYMGTKKHCENSEIFRGFYFEYMKN